MEGDDAVGAFAALAGNFSAETAESGKCPPCEEGEENEKTRKLRHVQEQNADIVALWIGHLLVQGDVGFPAHLGPPERRLQRLIGGQALQLATGVVQQLEDAHLHGVVAQQQAVRELAAQRQHLVALVERHDVVRMGHLQLALVQFEPAADHPDPLSPKELQVLRLVASGRSNTEIAALLGNSEGVIKNHCSAVFSKMGVRDRTQAVLRAIDLGWI